MMSDILSICSNSFSVLSVPLSAYPQGLHHPGSEVCTLAASSQWEALSEDGKERGVRIEGSCTSCSLPLPAQDEHPLITAPALNHPGIQPFISGADNDLLLGYFQDAIAFISYWFPLPATPL